MVNKILVNQALFQILSLLAKRDRNGDTNTLTLHAHGKSSTTVPAVSTVIHIDETSLPPEFEQTLVGTNPMANTVPDGWQYGK
jgi:hypothetical protein